MGILAFFNLRSGYCLFFVNFTSWLILFLLPSDSIFFFFFKLKIYGGVSVFLVCLLGFVIGF